MNILVTGGAGFLGSNLCERLVQNEGDHIYCLDNLQTGRMENIAELMGRSNFTFIQHDIVEPIDLPVDQIYNAACPASPPAYQEDPIHTMKTSIFGIINMLELAKKYGATLLQFSTSEVYGDALQHPQNENYWGNVNPDGIRSCYDEGKRAAETLCFDYCRMQGTKIKVIRIFNTFGPRMNPADGRVISNFVNQALRGEPITVYGDGTQTRSFCYVDDLIEGIVRMMNSGSEIHGPVNLGNPEEFTVLEMAEQVKKQIGSKSEITFQPLPKDDPKQRRPDISRAKELLGWEPKVHVRMGLVKVIEYYRGLLSETNELGESRLGRGKQCSAVGEV